MIELPLELVDVIRVEAGHQAELAFEGRRDRGRHHVGTRAGVEGPDLDGGIIDFRQRRYGELLVSHDAGQNDGSH